MQIVFENFIQIQKLILLTGYRSRISSIWQIKESNKKLNYLNGKLHQMIFYGPLAKSLNCLTAKFFCDKFIDAVENFWLKLVQIET